MVARRMDIQSTAYAAGRIDTALEGVSRIIEKKCQRPGGLFPSLRTVFYDWPERDQPTSWRLWIGPDELINVVSITSGGASIAGSLLAYDGAGPPYKQLQLDRSGSSAFGGGNTPQRSISVTGWYGYDDEQRPAGTLAAAISTTSATTCVVSNSNQVGVGNQIIVDTERMIVTGKSMSTTGVTLAADLANTMAATTVAVSSGAGLSTGETILLDGERMLIVDITGNTLIVKRAYDGTVLTSHTSGVTVYAQRTLTVTRGASGTTAAAHALSAPISRWQPDGGLQSLCIAEAIVLLQQENAGFARQVGDGEFAREVSNRGLTDLRKQVYNSELRRKARSWAV